MEAEAPRPDTLTRAQVKDFRHRLAQWYRLHARVLPWRGVHDPYRIWVSEIMLQQTRVAAVIDHYERFLRLFPTLLALALAPQADVLAAWSGLGYYRRARMLHRAAQFVVEELGGELPTNATDLRTLPGVGVYTAAAIASICFGQSVPVVDGNVERVLLRIAGMSESQSSATRTFLQRLAEDLVPAKRLSTKGGIHTNAAGDHNQAMMELGATLCTPRAPSCMLCPVRSLCRTRGEHPTPPRPRQRSRPQAYLLTTRKRGVVTEVLLAQRPGDASLMPGMFELPPLPELAVTGREPILRLRHAITNTNYYISVFAQEGTADRALQQVASTGGESLHWHALHRLSELPLTGLARKVLTRMKLHAVTGPETPVRQATSAP
jgi:A/G-specific adenine glycosylase